jgi:hypothetical protein
MLRVFVRMRAGVADEMSEVFKFLFSSCILSGVGRDSSISIATRYRLDSPGIESRWRQDFMLPTRPSLGPTQPPIQSYRVPFPGCKAVMVWR